jgi:hypothetical protein
MIARLASVGIVIEPSPVPGRATTDRRMSWPFRAEVERAARHQYPTGPQSRRAGEPCRIPAARYTKLIQSFAYF